MGEEVAPHSGATQVPLRGTSYATTEVTLDETMADGANNLIDSHAVSPLPASQDLIGTTAADGWFASLTDPNLDDCVLTEPDGLGFGSSIRGTQRLLQQFIRQRADSSGAAAPPASASAGSSSPGAAQTSGGVTGTRGGSTSGSGSGGVGGEGKSHAHAKPSRHPREKHSRIRLRLQEQP